MENLKVLASVGGEKITEADVSAAIMTLRSRGQDMDNEQGHAVILEELISQKLFLLDARKNLLEFNPEFKAQLQRMKDEMLVSYAITKAVEGVKVSEDEAKKFFEENKEKFVGSETVNASHILVADEEKAKEIKADIDAGKITFEDAAKQFSTCPSKENGGNLGDFGKGQMVPEFEAEAFSMEIGSISEPVKTQFGYHLIKLNAKTEAKPIEYAQIESQIKERLTQEKKEKTFRSKVNQLKILYPVDKF